ncbi:MAG TPA: hypothetical protein VHA73_13910 [Acidimicrobiales bacterium]|nr:hypothetical protein [Acidimicrobiales bacterium]
MLVDFRNAIAHGDENTLANAVATGKVKPTLGSYRAHRRSLNRLVDTMDRVVAVELAKALDIASPW